MFNRRYWHERKMEKRGQIELLTTLECLNYKKSSQQLPSCFIVMRDSPFCKMFSPLFCFEQGKTLENVSKKLYTIKIKKKKKETETKSSAWDLKMPKLAQILEQSSGTRQVYVSVFILFWSLYKANRFHVTVRLFSNRSQRTSKCGKNTSDTLACSSCATSLFLPHFDVICDLLLNRRTATWNLFVKYTTCKLYSPHSTTFNLRKQKPTL